MIKMGTFSNYENWEDTMLKLFNFKIVFFMCLFVWLPELFAD